MTKPETSIKSVFDRYSNTLSEQKEQMSKTIIKWGDDLISKIESHVSDQKKLLEQQFENRKRSLETKRKQYKSDVSQEKKKDSGQIDRLLAECKDLKFELAALNYYTSQIDFIQLRTEDQLTVENLNENSAEEIVEKPARIKSAKVQNQSVIDDGNANESSPPRLTPASPKPLRPPSASPKPPRPPSASLKLPSSRSVMTQTSIELDRTTNADDNSKSDIKNEDDMTNKCPICFMIFAHTMGKHDRDQHVNAHYGDD